MKHIVPLSAAALLAASFLAFSTPARQDGGVQFPQASPAALVRDQIGLTTVEVEYSRPGVKGREIFGGLVPYGEVWRTGANAATKVTFSSDVTFGGAEVPAGSYALFTVPGESEWTVILNEVVGQWGSYNYDPAGDVARVTAPVTKLPQPVETMIIALHDLKDHAASFTITWDRTRVAVPIETNLVETLVPQIEAAMEAGGDQKPYLAAAMFYYEHDVDLTKSIEWIDKALESQPEAVWILYRKGLILAKLGEKEAAVETARKTVEQAQKVGGTLGAEYTRLAAARIARVEG